MRYPPHPRRFVDLPSDQDPQRVGLLVASARAEPDEDAQPMRFPARQIWHRRVQRRTRLLRFALVGAGLFLVGGVVGAAVQPLLRSAAVRPPDSAPEVHPSSKRAGGPRTWRGRRADLTTADAPLVADPGMTGDGLPTAPSPPAPKIPSESGSLVEWAQADPGSLRGPGPTQATRHTASNLGGRAGTTVVGRARASAAPGVSFPTVRAPSPRPADQSVAPGAAVAPPAPAPVAPAVAAPLAPPTSPPAPVLPPAPAPAPSPPTAAVPAEQSLLTAALEKLRASHEPRAALALLDEHRRRFPTGEFAPEAGRLRTEALLLLGRKTAALDELEGSASTATAADERRVLRGELRAAAGRWQAACADFDDVVRAHAGPFDARWADLVERALWGRAAARSHLGDDAATKADLREYLHRFPNGRFAKPARRLLGEGG